MILSTSGFFISVPNLNLTHQATKQAASDPVVSTTQFPIQKAPNYLGAFCFLTFCPRRLSAEVLG